MSGDSRVHYAMPDARVLDEIESDVLVLTCFADERPLRGLAGLVDWRLCGAVSRMFEKGIATGALGERVLRPVTGRLSHGSLVLFGLGHRAEFRADRALSAAAAVVKTAVGLQATRITCDLFGMDQLPSPLEVTGKKLLDVLQADESITAIHIIAELEAQELLKKRPSLPARLTR